jgi:hypothetical protein
VVLTNPYTFRSQTVPIRTSENPLHANFGEYPFHALR